MVKKCKSKLFLNFRMHIDKKNCLRINWKSANLSRAKCRLILDLLQKLCKSNTNTLASTRKVCGLRICHYKKSAHNRPIKPTDGLGRKKEHITDRRTDQNNSGQKCEGHFRPTLPTTQNRSVKRGWAPFPCFFSADMDAASARPHNRPPRIGRF